MTIKNVNSSNLNTIALSSSNSRLDKTDTDQKSFADTLSKAGNSAKVDTIEISQQTTTNIPSLSQIRNQIISEINEDKDPEYIENLKEQVESGQYNISSQELAARMLSDME